MPLVRLPRPRTAYDPRPELWQVGDRLYLVYVPYLVTSPIVDHGPRPDGAYRCTTRNNEYCFEWAPTWRAATVERLFLQRRWITTRR